MKIKSIVLALSIFVFTGIFSALTKEAEPKSSSVLSSTTSNPIIPIDCFTQDSQIVEADSPTRSISSVWWVNSGARVSGSDQVCATIQGSLPANDEWRLLYNKNNPVDTDNGYHPQNLLRLIRTVLYKNVYQEVDFKIEKDNLSASPNRNQSNGVLFFMRYVNSDNLYYAGLRVDGAAVIKKKLNGIYTTLGQTKIFPGTYNRNSSPNLLPHSLWIGLRSEIVNLQNGGVLIRLYYDPDQSGSWKKILVVEDHTSPITGYGYGGIRGDFMDLKFRNYIQRGFSL